MISHRHRCIFVHVPKAGGTSIENLIWPAPAERSEADLWMGFVDRYHNRYQTGGLQHLLATQIRSEVGDQVFADYFKFAIVRNPWDRVISQFVYMRRREDLREFVGMRADDGLKTYLELISRTEHVQWMPQLCFTHDTHGLPLLDYVGRFERFDESVRHILDQLGIAARPIPHAMKGSRGRYQDYYDAESRERVAAMYADDIRIFGYQFDAD